MKTAINFTIDRHHTAPAYIQAVKEFNAELKQQFTADDLARFELERADSAEFYALRCDVESVWTGSSCSAYVETWVTDGLTIVIQRRYWLHQYNDGSLQFSPIDEANFKYKRP